MKSEMEGCVQVEKGGLCRFRRTMNVLAGCGGLWYLLNCLNARRGQLAYNQRTRVSYKDGGLEGALVMGVVQV